MRSECCKGSRQSASIAWIGSVPHKNKGLAHVFHPQTRRRGRHRRRHPAPAGRAQRDVRAAHDRNDGLRRATGRAPGRRRGDRDGTSALFFRRRGPEGQHPLGGSVADAGGATRHRAAGLPHGARLGGAAADHRGGHRGLCHWRGTGPVRCPGLAGNRQRRLRRPPGNRARDPAHLGHHSAAGQPRRPLSRQAAHDPGRAAPGGRGTGDGAGRLRRPPRGRRWRRPAPSPPRSRPSPATRCA